MILLCVLGFSLGCQSIGAYEAVCQEDEDCKDHQRCDSVSQACVLRSEYPACDPTLAIPECPVATSCDAEARACLPRPFRIAWFYRFDSSELADQKQASLYKYITRYVAESYFRGRSCFPQEETCQPGQIEIEFVDVREDAGSIADQVERAYMKRPFDLAIPANSASHEGLRRFNTSTSGAPYFLIFGRLNRLDEVVRRELESGYTPSPLHERFDFSAIPIQSFELESHALTQIFECRKPLMLYAESTAYRLSARIFERDMARQGICAQSMAVPITSQQAFPEVLKTLEEDRYDCIRTLFLDKALAPIMKDFVDSSNTSSSTTWFVQTQYYTSPELSYVPLQELIREQLPRDTFFVSDLEQEGLINTLIARQIKPSYRDYLRQNSCLFEPLSCDDLACKNPPSDSVAEACEVLECGEAQERSLPSCEKLGCHIASPPSYCSALDCPSTPTQVCETVSLEEFARIPADIAVRMDLVTAAHFLAMSESSRPDSVGPLSVEDLRDKLLSLYTPNNTIKTCGYPDINACITLLEQSQPFNYAALFSSGPFGDDARLQASTDNTVIYYGIDEVDLLKKEFEVGREDIPVQELFNDPIECP